MDVFDKEKRSWIMSRVRGRDTKPELAVRSLPKRLRALKKHLNLLGQKKLLSFRWNLYYLSREVIGGAVLVLILLGRDGRS